MEEDEEAHGQQAAPARMAGPPARSKVPIEVNTVQRPTVTGGWRQVVDKAWMRPIYVAPIAGRMTWSITEVIKTGGLDDLLLARHWEMCAVDPLAVEVMKDRSWVLRVFSSPSLSGQPVLAIPKGALVVVQVFHQETQTAMLVLPPSAPGTECAVGYVCYQLRDGRPLLRAMLPRAATDEESSVADMMGYAEPPQGAQLEGPFFVDPPKGWDNVIVTVGQDIESDVWARLPRGYCVRDFAEVLGFRARLPDLEGGGWVSLMGADTTPYFRKQPSVPPVLVLPSQVEVADAEDAKLPIVWPNLGVIRPPLPAPPEPVHVDAPLPEMLRRLGGGRALCDWERTPLPPSDLYYWKSLLTNSQTTLHSLLEHQIWKAAVVEAETLVLRERMDPRSPEVATLPQGSLVVAEWVAPTSAVRILLPGTANAPKPAHAWTDLGTATGVSLSQLVPGGEYWIEPRGGHLTLEEQRDHLPHDVARLPVRAGPEEDAPSKGYFLWGDGVQLLELRGRRARMAHTRCVALTDTAPEGGWIDLFDDSGWCVVRVKYGDEDHPAVELSKPLIMVPEDSMKKRIFRKGTSTERMSACDGAVDQDSQAYTETSSEAAAELPALLWQLGELEMKSVWTRDWREAVDPIWGQRYFVNKWSGQIIHRLSSMGVACPGVRLTVWYSNLSLAPLRAALGVAAAETRIRFIERLLLPSVAAIADVDEDRMTLQVLEGPANGGGDEAADHEDSALNDSSLRGAENDGFRIVALIRAPGARAAWASAALKQAMANGVRFSSLMMVLIAGVPDMLTMKVDPYGDVTLLKADLEELDLPRVADCFAPPPEPEGPPPLPVAEDFAELRRSYMFTKQKVLHFHCRKMGLGDSQALSDGLKTALAEPPLEELGMWGCGIGDGGAFAMAKALDIGCGANLHTLLLDENGIGAAGATALGAGLARCPNLRELGMSKNPLGAGFAKLLAGLGIAMVVLDASEASLDDAGAEAVSAVLKRLPALRALRLGGNVDIGPVGIEAVACALLGAPALKLADMRGCEHGGEWPRLKRVLEDGGVDPSRLLVQ